MSICPTSTSGTAAKLAAWVVECLPTLNGFAEKGCRNSAVEIATSGRCHAAAAIQSQPTGKMSDIAILVGDIGMIVSSLLRHGVDRSNPELVKLLCCLESLSGLIDHPPRESIYTYVLWNGVGGRGTRTFTGHALESNFIRLTRVALQHYDVAAGLLCKLDLGSSKAALDLGLAECALERVCSCYMELLRAFRLQPPDWFRAVYKPYFPAYVVGGIRYDPPSGAHGAAIMQLDCLLGCLEGGAATHCEARMIHLISVDRDRVLDALERGSIESQIECNLVLHEYVLRPLARVIRSFSRASALHWALIQKLLSGPEKLGRSNRDSDHVMSYGAVRQLAAWRRHPPLLSLVEELLANY